RTYEFLHSTFGEYLIGRLVARELDDLARVAAQPVHRARPGTPDDGFLHALLSFAPLSMRSTVLSFLGEHLHVLPEAINRVLRALLLELFHGALRVHPATQFSGYTPADLPVPTRHANYSANLLLLILLVGGTVAGSELFPEAIDEVREWRKL